MRKISAVLVMLCVATVVRCQVSIQDSADQIAVQVNGKPFTALRKGAEANKPYLYPVLSLSGKPVTRAFPMEHADGDDTDHPHQRSIWMGYERLSGMNLWEIDPADSHPRSGKILFGEVLETHQGTDKGSLVVSAQWLSPEGKPLIDEVLEMTFYAKPENVRMFDIDLRLKAKQLVTFEDHKDGIVGFRLARAFDEDQGGIAINAEGVRGTAKLDGIRTSWIDWQADLKGEKVGFVVMDHPANLNHPSSWLAKPMALFFANPFAQRYYDRSRSNGSLSMQPGDEIRLRYRVIIHPSDFDLTKAYAEYSNQ
ncbi:MAG TPA: PmoA family protein [Terriglobales bacterium]|jgi:hypothetical protein